MLLDTEEGQKAAKDFHLLAQVVKHKKVFFRSAWASYDTAKPSSLKIVPPDARLEDLRADYREMAAMMFDGDLTLRLQFSTVLHSGCATRWVRSREPAQTTAQSE